MLKINVKLGYATWGYSFVMMTIMSLLFAVLTIAIDNAFGLTINACIDQDKDGYGSPGDALCRNGSKEDCDDNDPNVFPGAAKICDGKDNNCDGVRDFASDVDNDGDGWPLCKGDCNDSDPNVYPGNSELFGTPLCSDLKDNDCNRQTDQFDINCKVSCKDNDADGYGNPGNSYCAKGSATDCNDYVATINPGASDNTCNGIDENCNGITDDGFVPTTTTCGTGICTTTGQNVCQYGIMVNTCTPVTEGPLSSFMCSDGKDNDCDGKVDSSDPGCSGSVTLTWYAPATNSDGTQLTDLDGYKIYYGPSARTYQNVMNAQNSTTYTLNGLSQGNWCFAVVAYDMAGNESSYSNEVCTIVN